MNKQNLNLHPHVELAKHFTNSPVCKINIIEPYYQYAEANNVEKATYNDSICNDTIRQNGINEIEDLSNDIRYENHPYVKESPNFRYYCGAKLTTKNGIDIGSICVLDKKSKRISNRQKEQLQQLALLVINTIECENRYKDIASKLDTLSDSIHKLNHDLRTPISGIVGMTDLLIEEKNHVEFPDQELKMIKESSETTLSIIDEVLENLDNGNSQHKKAGEKPLTDVIEKIKHLYNPLVQKKDLSLTFTNQVDTSVLIPHYFSLKLLQIIGNLVSNSTKFTPENGAIEVIITRDSELTQDILNITVKDNGKGMTSDQISAFNSGKSIARSSGTNGEKSFGVGLKHVKQMINEEGGTITVKARQSKGTEFSISLPIPVNETDTLSKPMPLFQQINGNANGKSDLPIKYRNGRGLTALNKLKKQ